MDAKTVNRSAREAALKELNSLAEGVGVDAVALRRIQLDPALIPPRKSGQGLSQTAFNEISSQADPPGSRRGPRLFLKEALYRMSTFAIH